MPANRLIWQLLFMLAVSAALATVLQISRTASFASAAAVPDSEQCWAEGLWPLQDQIKSFLHAQTSGLALTPHSVKINVDVSAVSRWRFAPFENTAWLAAALANTSAPAAMQTSVRYDLDLSLRSYRRGDDFDILAGVMHFRGGGAAATTNFVLHCPVFGRAWFVRSTPVLEFWLCVAMTLGLCLAGALGIWGAWQTLALKYNRSAAMNFGTAFAFGLLVFLIAAEFAPAGFAALSAPRRTLRVVLDTSDAVRFPDAGKAAVPDDPAALDNAVYRFIRTCLASVNAAIADDYAMPQDNFFAWLRRIWRDPWRDQRRIGRKASAGGATIFHNLPLLDVSSNAPSLTPVPAGVALEVLPEIFLHRPRGQSPGFFLPWGGLSADAPETTILAFLTGEPASLQQAEWLEQNRALLRRMRPPRVRVISVLLPTVPRSAHPGWKFAACLRNVDVISDAVAITFAGTETELPGGLSAEILRVPVFKNANIPSARMQETGHDLDLLRAEMFTAAAAPAEAAEKISALLRRFGDVRSTAVFQHSFPVAILGVCLVAALLLFWRLQQEVRALDLGQPRQRLALPGACWGLAAALMGALLLGYATSEPMRWQTFSSMGTVLWSIVFIWYCSFWLPVILGRWSGTLPAPARMLRVKHLAVLLAMAVFAACATTIASGVLYFIGVKTMAGQCALGGGFFSAAMFFSLVVRYLWISFWRGTRRRVVLAGIGGAIILIGVLLGNTCLAPAGKPWPIWLTASAAFGAVLLPLVAAWSARRPADLAKMPTRWDWGWEGVIGGLFVGLAAALLLLFPLPL